MNVDAIDQLVATATSPRGALFALRDGFAPLDGGHLGFEFLLSERNQIRADLINPTTLPAEFGALYLKAGGPGFDPVIDRISSGDRFFSLDLRSVLTEGPARYRTSEFLRNLVELGCPVLSTVCLPEGETSGRVLITVMDNGAWPSAFAETEQAEFLRAVLRALRRHGHLRRYFGLSPKEIETLRNIASGQSAADISAKGGVTRRAIESRLQAARRKLSSKTTPELMFKATAYGLI